VSVTIDQVIQRYKLDDQFSAKAAKVTAMTFSVARAFDQALVKSLTLKNAVNVVAGAFRTLGYGLMATGGAVAGIVAFGIASLKAAGEQEALRRSLEAVLGTQERATQMWTRLKALAIERGLDVGSVVDGVVKLKSAKLPLELAERAVLAVGNAIRSVGRGNTEMQAVLYNFTQIASIGRLTGDELKETLGYLPQLRSALKAAFGTDSLEGLRGKDAQTLLSGIVRELEKAKLVTGGIQMTFDNLKTTAWLAFGAVGDALAKHAIPMIQTFTNWVLYLEGSGALTRITNGMLGLFNMSGSKSQLLESLAWITAFMMNLPGIVRDSANYMMGAFMVFANTVGEVFRVVFSIFLTGALFKAVVAVVQIFRTLVVTIRTLAAMQAFSTAATVAGIAAIAAAAAIAYGIYEGMGKLVGEVDAAIAGVGAGFQNLPAFKKMQVDYQQIKAGFGSFKIEKPEMPDDNAEVIKPMNQIAKATMATARNTEAQLDLARYALGGGDTARFAVTPVELRRMRGGARTVNVRVTGADESINRMLTDIFRQVMPLVSPGW
jgi:tape measure domain-containing protein